MGRMCLHRPGLPAQQQSSIAFAPAAESRQKDVRGSRATRRRRRRRRLSGTKTLPESGDMSRHLAEGGSR